MNMNVTVSGTGIVRRIDDLGRVAIPKDLRRAMRIRENDSLEFFTSKEGGVYIRGYRPVEPQQVAEISKDFLNKYREHIYNRCQAKFFVENGITKCEVIYNDTRRVGIAKWNPEDRYDVNIGMVVSFCRAVGWVIPDGIL